MKSLYRIVCCFVIMSFLGLGAACGIKPSELDPPSGAEKTVYPRTYPDLSTDPK